MQQITLLRGHFKGTMCRIISKNRESGKDIQLNSLFMYLRTLKLIFSIDNICRFARKVIYSRKI